ncbi:phosphatases II, partial [Rhizodiscina lignyota]
SENEPPIPPFLLQTRSDIHNKFGDLEWQQRVRIAAGHNPPSPASPDSQPSPWSRLDPTSNAEILRRNRYQNVEPWAANRVRLLVPEGVSDYINASPIILTQTVSGIEKRFIATQGPKEGTESHIWRMVYAETGKEDEKAVIVMLTQTHEQGREKCFQYFPADMVNPVFAVNEQDEFADGFTGTLTLKSIAEDQETRSTVREIDLETCVSAASATSMTHTEQPESTTSTTAKIHKPITHLLFGGWPDFLVPEGPDRAALLNLISLSAKLNSNPSNPRIVHCSAGVGRSGTFIALDFLLQEIAEGAWDDLSPFEARDPVLECVDALRKQRMMMVQGEGQFAFLYDVCREAWVER